MNPPITAEPRILFLTPNASRSGAPINLLHLMRWMRRDRRVRPATVLGEGGPLAGEFAAEGPVAVYKPPFVQRTAPIRRVLRVPAVSARIEASRAARCRAVVDRWPPDAVFCNSIASAKVLRALGPYPCPVVVNVHELEFVIRDYAQYGDVMGTMREAATHFVACSRAVAENLTDRHGIPADRVSVVYECVPTADFDPAGPTGSTAPADPAVRAAAGVPPGVPLVGVVGGMEWRKGVDLLAPVARRLLATRPGAAAHVAWVGHGTDYDRMKVSHDLAAAGIADRVHLVGPTDRPAAWYRQFAALALLSREDPFPLVALEAAACGVPVVCFAGAGGMPEFVEADAGFVVPYLDLAAFADAAGKIVDDPGLRDRLGRVAAAKVRARHDVSVVAPQMFDVVGRLVGGRVAGR